MPVQITSVILSSLWVFSLGSIFLTLYRWFFDKNDRIPKAVVSRVNFAIPVLGTLNFIGMGVLIYSLWVKYTSGFGTESYSTLVMATAVWGVVYLFSHLLLPQLFWIPAMRRIPALSLAFLIPIALTPVVGAWLLNSLFDWYPEAQFGFAIGFSIKHVWLSLVALGVVFYIIYKDEERRKHLKKNDENAEDDEEIDMGTEVTEEVSVDMEEEPERKKKKKKGKKKKKKSSNEE